MVCGVVCACGGGGGGRVQAQISAFGNRCISLYFTLYVIIFIFTLVSTILKCTAVFEIMLLLILTPHSIYVATHFIL